MNRSAKGFMPVSRSKKSLMCDSDGFALPSVLFLVSLFSILILLIVFAEYFRRSLAYRELSKVKANVAAQNGIVWAKVNSTVEASAIPFPDGTTSDVASYDWGLYRLVVSKGSSGRFRAEYAALLGQKPGKRFTSALEFANDQHQLVFGGEVSIIGDLHTGSPGATTGTLPGGRKPTKSPVKGKATRGGTFAGFDFGRIERQIASFNGSLGVGNSLPKSDDSATAAGAGELIDLATFQSDTSSTVFLNGNKRLSGTMIRRGTPVTIVVRGAVTFDPGAYLYGPIRILSSKRAIVPKDAHIEYGIIYSASSIQFLSSTGSRVQLISPRVSLEDGARLSYPSAIISYVFPTDDNKGGPRSIVIEKGSELDGVAMMNRRVKEYAEPEVIELDASASIIGSVYCEERMTLDGRVFGNVRTNDFYFYLDPTRYYGWLRGGVIDRGALPASYLVPIGFDSTDINLEILDWI